MTALVRLGARGSPLARVQATMVAQALREAHGWDEDAIAIVPIRTSGDRIQDRPLAEAGGKGLFTKELDAALLDGRIDLAVHSMKDVETVLHDGLAVVAMLARADERDRLITIDGLGFDELPQGARVGTSSLRRAAQARHLRPDLRIVAFRGNVDTRLQRLADGEADATFLAAAGLDRLGSADVGVPLSEDLFLPAPAQGAIGIEVRGADARVRRLVEAIDHRATSDAVAIERALLARLDGSCRTPIAALARIAGGTVTLTAEILLPDGSERRRAERTSTLDEALAAAAELGSELKARASPTLRAMFGA